MSGDAELTLGEGEDLLRRHTVHVDISLEDLIAVAMVETVSADRVVPASVPFELPHLVDTGEDVGGGHANRFALDRDVEASVPVVTTREQDHARVVLQVHDLLLIVAGTEVQGLPVPHRDQWCDVRSSIRAH